MFDLPETITIWHPVGNDGLGGITWAAPVAIPGRIALKQEKFTDKNGDQQISKAVCYTESDDIMTTGARVYFGASTDLDPPADSNDVRAFTATPSATTMKKAWF